MNSFTLYDRFGRAVGQGDAVMLLNKADTAWRIASVELQLPKTPQDPPAHLKVTMAAVFINGVPGGIPIGDMIKVRDVSEMPQDPTQEAQRRAEGNGTESEPTGEPPTP